MLERDGPQPALSRLPDFFRAGVLAWAEVWRHFMNSLLFAADQELALYL
jgi:hypothetical protein